MRLSLKRSIEKIYHHSLIEGIVTILTGFYLFLLMERYIMKLHFITLLIPLVNLTV